MTDKPTRHLRVFPATATKSSESSQMTEAPGNYLRTGCIPSNALRDLAMVMDGLVRWHDRLDGKGSDLPCLRRVEMDDGHVVAHVSSGPDVGGIWYRFLLGPHGWKMEGEG